MGTLVAIQLIAAGRFGQADFELALSEFVLILGEHRSFLAGSDRSKR